MPSRVISFQICAARSSDEPLDSDYPPAVCTLPVGHEGMHCEGGRCSWDLVEVPARDVGPMPSDAPGYTAPS